MRIFRSNREQKREGLSWDERWKGRDKGLIACWEVGNALSQKDHQLAEKARNGELPVLGWKGGVSKKIQGKKYGPLYYLAQWQGLRGEDLDIDIAQEKEMTCSKTGMRVIYTADPAKYSKL